MKARLFFYTLLSFISAFCNSQELHKNKCTLVKDKETSREYYTTADIAADEPDGFKPLEFTIANFRLPNKTYGKKDRIYFEFIVEKNGALTFLKLRDLESDADILAEVKRMISIMPNYAAAICGKTKVPFLKEISFPLDWLKKNK